MTEAIVADEKSQEAKTTVHPFANPYQADDGNRNALEHFMENRDDKLRNHLQLLIDQGEYWKSRVLLELVWEYEKSHGSSI